MVSEEQQILGPKTASGGRKPHKKIIVDALSRMEAQGETVRTKSQDLGPLV